MKPQRSLESKLFLALPAALVLATGCGGGSTGNLPAAPSGPLTLSLSTGTVVAPQDGTPGTIGVTITGADPVGQLSVAANNLPRRYFTICPHW